MSGTTITGSYSSGIRLSDSSQNPVTVSNTAAISAASGFGLYLATGVDWTLTNGGQLYGGFAGLLLPGGGMVTNQSGGTIGASGGSADGIQLGGDTVSTVVNNGLIAAPGNGVFSSGTAYVYNQSGGTIIGLQGVNIGSGSVNNAGTINATGSAGGTYGIGVELLTNGVVTNQAGAYITASHLGVDMSANQGTVINDGTIGAGYYGVQRASLVTNQSDGTITGGKAGVNLTTGTVLNAGSIGGTGTYATGVVMTSGGYVTNVAGAIISGSHFGVNLSGGPGTIANAGTIAGVQAAVSFGNDDVNRLIIYPTATFVGTVNGGDAAGSPATSTLELASSSGAGVLTGLGSEYIDFTQIVVDTGATWSLAGSNTIGTGVTLSGPAAITLAAGATLDIAGTVASGETIVFGGSGATLVVESTASMAGAVAGFGTNDVIDLQGVAPASVSYASGALDYTAPGGGSATFPLALAGVGGVQALDDGASGADVTPLCFCPGTRLATPDGGTLVEHLAVGDTVLTASGAERRIVWIGVGRVLATRGRRSAATPVIVRKGALADDVPFDDLRVTKGHALWFDGVLIPVEFLVNHRSILWDDMAQEVTLYHVELDRHDVLLANGAPAESYRDDGNRWLFRNGNSGWGLPALPPCAPVLTGGPVVDAVWRRLLDRAGPRPGVPVTGDADLHLSADGVRVDAAWRDGSVCVFRLKARPGSVRVLSRSGVPQELGLARDARPLGVALRRVVLRQGARLAVLEAGDPRLTQGFHGFEPELGLRWTNGDAALPAGVFDSFDGPTDVEVHLGGATQYPAYPMELAA